MKSIAENLEIRRATLSARVNGHAPFTPALLASVAAMLGCSATEIVGRAERAVRESHAREQRGNAASMTGVLL